jgi:hypothetical protein
MKMIIGHQANLFATSFLDDLQVFENALGSELHGFPALPNSGKLIIGLFLRIESLLCL